MKSKDNENAFRIFNEILEINSSYIPYSILLN